MRAGSAEYARARLEHRPRNPFKVDEERALDILRQNWARWYDIGVDGEGRWWGIRRDGLPAVSVSDIDGPEGLQAAMIADCTARPPGPAS